MKATSLDNQAAPGTTMLRSFVTAPQFRAPSSPMTRINPTITPALSRPTAEPVAQPPVAQNVNTVDRFEGNGQVQLPVGAQAATALVAPTVTTGGPNNFQVELAGHYPPVAAGGLLTELHQGEMTAANSLKANVSILSHGHEPSDADVRSQLAGLHRTPPTGESNASISNYSSTIPGASAASVYNDFTSQSGGR